MVTEVKKYITEDGKEFYSLYMAQEHEQMKKAQAKSQYQKFIEGYSGKRLLEKYSLTTEGLWRVLGEDSNPDMGGSHVMPYLGTVEGKLEDVIKWAVVQPKFWAWGSGGDIERVVITRI